MVLLSNRRHQPDILASSRRKPTTRTHRNCLHLESLHSVHLPAAHATAMTTSFAPGIQCASICQCRAFYRTAVQKYWTKLVVECEKRWFAVGGHRFVDDTRDKFRLSCREG